MTRNRRGSHVIDAPQVRAQNIPYIGSWKPAVTCEGQGFRCFPSEARCEWEPTEALPSLAASGGAGADTYRFVMWAETPQSMKKVTLAATQQDVVN